MRCRTYRPPVEAIHSSEHLKTASGPDFRESISELSFAAHPAKLSLNLFDQVFDDQCFNGHPLVQRRLNSFSLNQVVEGFAICDNCSWHVQLVLGVLDVQLGLEKHLEKHLEHEGLLQCTCHSLTFSTQGGSAYPRKFERSPG